MKFISQKFIWIFTILFALEILTGGCTTKSHAQAETQKAFLAGQNQELRQQQQQELASKSVTIIGAVEHSQVPWVEGLTLAQALATANYLNPNEPEIILTRNGEAAHLSAQDVLSGAAILLEPGDIVELRPRQ
jgi:hypothetical protein